METMKMFCFPFAGGNKYSYQEYQQLAPDFIHVIPLELPGRGKRSDEAMLTDIHNMVDDIFFQMKSDLDKPYVLYGHSMGGLLAYLVAKRIVKSFYNKPSHLFITGCTAPSTRIRSDLHLFPKKAFIEELRILGGCPDEILNNEESMNFFEKVIRADFQAVEEYRYQPDTPLDIQITAMFGTAENVSRQDMTAWQKETTEELDIIQVPGGHFFIYQFGFQIIKVIARKINHQLQKL